MWIYSRQLCAKLAEQLKGINCSLSPQVLHCCIKALSQFFPCLPFFTRILDLWHLVTCSAEVDRACLRQFVRFCQFFHTDIFSHRYIFTQIFFTRILDLRDLVTCSAEVDRVCLSLHKALSFYPGVYFEYSLFQFKG